ncbi:hypothetical protein EW145_g2731 [Phellinidium pouzarii]|uniref:Amino acid permease/ SLC12A domain-containing protein n=1 Tax=Phellinidium pouzarii TaxID=167371 RepID=A0A4V3XD51_9AGAM|nr:hypothetical protein EW145_g2731 [Phellinidium pouzarii]
MAAQRSLEDTYDKKDCKEYRASDIPALEEEDSKLKRLGIRPELRREFTSLSTISFALGVVGCAASVASTLNTPLLLGGPATVVWAWLLGSVGCICIALSVAELVSAYPTAGGLYTSTAYVVPSEYRASITFVSGWMTIMGQLAAPASGTYALSQMIFSAATIATDGNFVASSRQILGLYVGLIVALGMTNSLPTKYLHKLYTSYVYLNIFTTLAVIIAVPAAGAGKLASHKFVWTEIIDSSGWDSKGFVFLLGLLSVQWVMTDYDGAAPICYGIQDFSALPGPTGLAFAQNALPDRKMLAKVWSRTGTPVYASIFSVVIITAFGMLSLASSVAINAVFSIVAVALDVTYMIPITAKAYIFLRRDGDVNFTPGPFYMGKWGYIINVYAILWTCLETGVLIMPQVRPVTGSTMNYAGPIMGGVCGLSWVWYKLYWHRFYFGPGKHAFPSSLHSEEASSASITDDLYLPDTHTKA